MKKEIKKSAVNGLIREVIFKENGKETLFQISVFSAFLLFFCLWEPVSMYFIYRAIESEDVGTLIMISAVSAVFLGIFLVLQYINNTYADRNSWKIAMKVREHFFRKYYKTIYFSIHHKFSGGEIFDRITHAGMAALTYVMNYVGIFIFTISGILFLVYYIKKVPYVVLAVFFFVILELTISNIMMKKVNSLEADKRKVESVKAEKSEVLFENLELDLMYGDENKSLDCYMNYVEAGWKLQKKKELFSEGILCIHIYVQSFLQIILQNNIFKKMQSGKLMQADSLTLLLILDKLTSMIKEIAQRILETGQMKVSVERAAQLEKFEERPLSKENSLTKKDGEAVLDVKNLSVSFEERKILTDINLTILKGEKIAVIGENGSGKSTLLKTILGLVRASSGNCYVNGKMAAYIPAEPFLFSESVDDNIDMGCDTMDKELQKSVMEICKNFEFRKPEELSGGQKQLVNICRGVVKKADILFADEPTSHLPKEKSAEVMSWLISSSSSCMVITHDLSLLPLFTKVYQIRDGKIKEVL